MHDDDHFSFFAEALKYSSSYLICTVTAVALSIVFVWIYETPNVLKFLLKQSKHSHIIGSESSNEKTEVIKSRSIVRDDYVVSESFLQNYVIETNKQRVQDKEQEQEMQSVFF